MQHICFVADGHSEIAINWISYFKNHPDYRVSLISTYPSLLGDDLHTEHLLIGGGRYMQIKDTPQKARNRKIIQLRSGKLAGVFAAASMMLSIKDVYQHGRAFQQIIADLKPDLVHALRFPFEGLLAAQHLPPSQRFMASVWGNDFTLHSNRNTWMKWKMRSAMKRIHALHADCWRDIHLAAEEGFDKKKPHLVVPTNGGIRSETFHPGAADEKLRQQLQIPADAPVIINPRGIRYYIRNDLFFQAIPLILQKYPEAVFVCVGMEGNALIENWVEAYGIQSQVRLLPHMTPAQMGDLFRLATITVSAGIHDGTPNTLLEAMACGSFPVVGDLPSIREWITHQENGLLFECTTADAIATSVITALDNAPLREEAQRLNFEMIAERALYENAMRKVEHFYQELICAASPAL